MMLISIGDKHFGIRDCFVCNLVVKMVHSEGLDSFELGKFATFVREIDMSLINRWYWGKSLSFMSWISFNLGNGFFGKQNSVYFNYFWSKKTSTFRLWKSNLNIRMAKVFDNAIFLKISKFFVLTICFKVIILIRNFLLPLSFDYFSFHLKLLINFYTLPILKQPS